MLICLLNDRLFPCPRTHALHVRKLAEGFVQRGYHFKEIEADELQHLSEVDVVYISNHFSTEPLHRLLKTKLQGRLMALLRKTRASLVLWSFHTTADWNALKTLRQRVLHLGEDLYRESIDQEPVLSRFRREFPVLALRYAAPFLPQLSKRIDLPKEYDFNFVGHGYQRELTQHCEQRYRCLIRNTPPSVSEPLRVNSFRRAEINLVFHSTAGAAKGIVVERFAEALCLGGIVFHDHPRIARDFADLPSLFLVRTPAELDAAYARVNSMSEERKAQLREASWQRWRTAELSYYDQAGRILAALHA